MNRYRRHPALIAWWDGEAPVFCNFIRKAVVRPEREVFNFLTYFHTWRTVEEARAAFPTMQAFTVRLAVERLTARGLMEREGADPHPEELDKGVLDWSWDLPVQLFHVVSRDTNFATSMEQMIALQVEQILAEAPPELFVNYPHSTRTPLPRTLSPCSTTLDEALLKRRTVRQFLDVPLSLETLSRLLFMTWGTAGVIVDQVAGPLIHRTSPSGGSKHSIEVYPVVRKVEGLDPGIYHYATEDHSLELIKGGDFAQTIAELTANQLWIAQAAVIFIMSGRIERIMWKYPFARSYRVLLTESGHLAQSLYLNATALGLGAFTTLAFTDTKIEAELGLEGTVEPALSICGAGVPDPQEYSSIKLSVERQADGSLQLQTPLWQPPAFKSPYIADKPASDNGRSPGEPQTSSQLES